MLTAKLDRKETHDRQIAICPKGYTLSAGRHDGLVPVVGAVSLTALLLSEKARDFCDAGYGASTRASVVMGSASSAHNVVAAVAAKGRRPADGQEWAHQADSQLAAGSE